MAPSTLKFRYRYQMFVKHRGSLRKYSNNKSASSQEQILTKKLVSLQYPYRFVYTVSTVIHTHDNRGGSSVRDELARRAAVVVDVGARAEPELSALLPLIM